MSIKAATVANWGCLLGMAAGFLVGRRESLLEVAGGVLLSGAAFTLTTVGVWMASRPQARPGRWWRHPTVDVREANLPSSEKVGPSGGIEKHLGASREPTGQLTNSSVPAAADSEESEPTGQDWR
jgi:hypothetical protein